MYSIETKQIIQKTKVDRLARSFLWEQRFRNIQRNLWEYI